MDVKRRIVFYPLKYFMTERQQRILDLLFPMCQDRMMTSQHIMLKMLEQLNLLTEQINRDNLLDIIRRYKQTSKNLEQTIKDVEAVLYPQVSLWSNDFGRADD